MMASATSMSRLSAIEQLTGRRINAKLDLRVGFGDYLQCTVAMTDNSMTPRTEGAIAMLPSGSLTGSVRVFKLSTDKFVTRDQFRILPIPDGVINYLEHLAKRDGMRRGGIEDPAIHNQRWQEVDNGDNRLPLLPTMLAIGDKPATVLPDDHFPQEAGVEIADQVGAGVSAALPIDVARVGVHAPDAARVGVPTAEPEPDDVNPEELGHVTPLRRSQRLQKLGLGEMRIYVTMIAKSDAEEAITRRSIVAKQHYADEHFVFKISVKKALKEG